MASVKPKLKYHLIEGLNPKSKAKLLRPVITERETLLLDVRRQHHAGPVPGLIAPAGAAETPPL